MLNRTFNAVDQIEELRDASLRDDDVVVDLAGRDPEQRRRDLAPDAPEVLALRLGRRAKQFLGAGGATGRLDAIGFSGHLLGEPVDLDEKQRARLGRRETAADVPGDRLERIAIDQLQARRHDPRLDDARRGVDRVTNRSETSREAWRRRAASG